MLLDLHFETNNLNHIELKNKLVDYKEKGVKYIAVTNSYPLTKNEELHNSAEELGITIIPAIKVQCYDFQNNKKVDLLGYNMNVNYTGFNYVYSIRNKLNDTIFNEGYINIEIALRMILDGGGVPVIANPGRYNNFEDVGNYLRMGLKGIEVYSEGHSEEDEIKALKIAEKYNLIVIGSKNDLNSLLLLKHYSKTYL